MVCKSLELVALKGRRLTVVMREQSAGRKLSSLALHGTRVWVIEKRPLGRGTRKAVPCTKKRNSLAVEYRSKGFLYPRVAFSKDSNTWRRDGHCGKISHGGKGERTQSRRWSPCCMPDSRPDTGETKLPDTG